MEKEEEQEAWIKELAEAFLMLETVEEVTLFLKDILDTQELKRVPKRWQVIKHLLERQTHRSTQKVTGASTYTISRASRTVIKEGTGISKVVWKRLNKST